MFQMMNGNEFPSDTVAIAQTSEKRLPQEPPDFREHEDGYAQSSALTYWVPSAASLAAWLAVLSRLGGGWLLAPHVAVCAMALSVGTSIDSCQPP